MKKKDNDGKSNDGKNLTLYGEMGYNPLMTHQPDTNGDNFTIRSVPISRIRSGSPETPSTMQKEAGSQIGSTGTDRGVRKFSLETIELAQSPVGTDTGSLPSSLFEQESAVSPSTPISVQRSVLQPRSEELPKPQRASVPDKVDKPPLGRKEAWEEFFRNGYFGKLVSGIKPLKLPSNSMELNDANTKTRTMHHKVVGKLAGTIQREVYPRSDYRDLFPSVDLQGVDREIVLSQLALLHADKIVKTMAGGAVNYCNINALSEALSNILCPQEYNKSGIIIDALTLTNYINTGKTGETEISRLASPFIRSFEEIQGLESQQAAQWGRKLAKDISALAPITYMDRTVIDKIVEELLDHPKGQEALNDTKLSVFERLDLKQVRLMVGESAEELHGKCDVIMRSLIFKLLHPEADIDKLLAANQNERQRVSDRMGRPVVVPIPQEEGKGGEAAKQIFVAEQSPATHNHMFTPEKKSGGPKREVRAPQVEIGDITTKEKLHQLIRKTAPQASTPEKTSRAEYLEQKEQNPWLSKDQLLAALDPEVLQQDVKEELAKVQETARKRQEGYREAREARRNSMDEVGTPFAGHVNRASKREIKSKDIVYK